MSKSGLTTSATGGKSGAAVPAVAIGGSDVEIIAVAIVMSVYASTVYASIPGGDSGELVAEACTLGHPHPPGYPLLTMLYHAVTVLPFRFFPSVDTFHPSLSAWRANMLSAVFGALASGCVAKTAVILAAGDQGKTSSLVSRICAATSGIAFACSPLVWQYSVGAEVFALNNFFATLLLLLTAQYASSKSTHYVDMGAFTCGLALTNQHTCILFEIPLILWILHDMKKTLTARLVFRWSLLFLVGLLPYAYLPATGFVNGLQQGSWSSSMSFGSFFHHLRRGDYGTFQLFSGNDTSAVGFWKRNALYAHDMTWRQGLGGAVPLIALLGWVLSPHPAAASKGKRRSRIRLCETNCAQRMALPLLLALAFYLSVFHFLSNMPLNEELLFGVQARFWMQPNAVVFVLYGAGASRLCQRAFARRGRRAASFVTFFVCIGALLQVALHQSKMDQSKNDYFERYARALLEPLPRNAVFLTNYDHQYTSTRYVQMCAGVRTDVIVINLSMMTFSWFARFRGAYAPLNFTGTHLVAAGSVSHQKGGFSFREFLKSNPNAEMFLGGKLPFRNVDKTYQDEFDTQPFGLLSRFAPKAGMMPPLQWMAADRRIWGIVDGVLPPLPLDPQKYDGETWESTIALDYFEHVGHAAAELLQISIEAEDLAGIAHAARMLERCYANNHAHLTAGNVKNLGLAYVKMVQLKKEWDESVDGLIMDRGFGVDAVAIETAGSQHWKQRASMRAYIVWSEFLQMPASRSDSSFAGVKNTVEVLKKIVEDKKEPKGYH